MSLIQVRTQAELDVAIRDNGEVELLEGSFHVEVSGTASPTIIVRAGAALSVEAWDSSQPRVEARESSQPRVEAWGSSQPRVEAWESSQPRVVALGSSQPRVEARESSQPRVEARESSQPRVEAWESSQPRVEAWESSQPRVVARDSSQPRVVAWESSQPRVVARGSSQPRVEARESSQPRVEARESSQPRVEAWGYAQLSVLGHVVAKCSAHVAVLIHGKKPVVSGGKQTCVNIKTPLDWCDYYGVKVARGVATVFRAVDDDYSTRKARSQGIFYTPGSRPAAPDWDGGERECGGGLHASPSPSMAKSFTPDAARFVACRVRLSDMRPPQEDDEYPGKIKFKGCCKPVFEVNEDGEPLE